MKTATSIYEQVRNHYGSLARGPQPTCSDGIAKAFGYSEEELNSIPAEANLGVSCGNPLAIASLREGETVIDLGSGAGFDVFLASGKVKATGRAIGVDMNVDMLARARQNQEKWVDASNVSFVEAQITSIPLQDGIADCIISNCVINLVPEGEKHLVFAEMARLLKSGGRVAVSDILIRKPLPPGLRENVALYVGCIAGASTKDDYERWLKDAGFSGKYSNGRAGLLVSNGGIDITIIDARSDLNVYTDMARAAQEEGAPTSCCDSSKNAVKEVPVSCCGNGNEPAGETPSSCCLKADQSKTASDPQAPGDLANDLDLENININEWAGSFKIFAIKP